MEYIRAGAPQFKANLHSHSVLSDGKLTPEELVEIYREHGYAVLAITDHEAPYDHTALSTPEMLLVSGYEAYIRPSADAKQDPFGPEVHLNLFARQPHNTTYICYDPPFCKYMPHAEAEALAQAGAREPRRYTPAYINAFIEAARGAGYLVSYNHPGWSMEAEADIMAYRGCFSLEMFNTGAQQISGYECNGALYDRLLRSGRRLYCHGADDNHNVRPLEDPRSDSYGAWTMILASELKYDSILAALEKGDFYASTGPEITSLSILGTVVSLECSPAVRIRMVESPKRTAQVAAEKGKSVTHANFIIPPEAPYVRFSVTAADGTQAHTRAFFRDELGL